MHSSEHGGQLRAASQRYGIPLADWLDLSTGISPWAYPLPPVPTECWQRLPESDDALLPAAAAYYGSEYLVAVQGSQQAIQLLPQCWPRPQRVGIISPAYASHWQAWAAHGHEVQALNPAQVEQALPTLDVLVVVNPTNPTAIQYPVAQLRQWQHALAARGRLLVVDEAFMDVTPTHSLLGAQPSAGLLVLRSLGKFFGLAGVRLGFVWAEPPLLQTLAALQGDWAVSHVARWAGTQALQDEAWQQQQRERLLAASARLHALLQQHFPAVASTPLFSYVQHPQAVALHAALAHQGILTRQFVAPAALRFGLPATPAEWSRLAEGLARCRL